MGTVEAAMNFTLGTMEEATEAAKQAEFTGGNFIKEPGAYAGIVETAVFKKFTSGAGGVEIAIKTPEGQTCKVMIITMKKDGTSTYKNGKGELMPLPGINQIRGALMPCLRQKELAATQNGDDIIYTSVVGQPLGMLVNIRKTLGKTNGKPDPKKVYDNADLKTFFCPKTNLCGSEILNKITTPERKAKIEEGLKVIDETAIEAPAAGATNPADPFGDAGATTGGAVADPFASDTAAQQSAPAETTPPAAQEQAVQEPAAQAPPVQETVASTPAESAPPVQESTPAASGAAAQEVDPFWG